MNDKKKVSIIITCYNYGRFVADAINSALNQLYINIEVIVVNDGSTDNSDEVIRTFGDKIIYINQKNQGSSQARNIGVKSATGNFCICLDADDWIAPEYIQDAVSLIEDEYTIISPIQFNTDTHLNINGDVWPDQHIILSNINDKNSILICNRCVSCSLFSKKLWSFVNGYDTKTNRAEDWIFWIDLVMAGCKIKYLINHNYIYYKYRKHGPSRISTISEEEVFTYVCKKYGVFKDVDGKLTRIKKIYFLVLGISVNLFELKKYINFDLTVIRDKLFRSKQFKKQHKL